MLDLHDTRCPRCAASPLHTTAGVECAAQTPDEIRPDAVRCSSCGASYGVIWGAPFLGGFEATDVTGLVEIAANARADTGCPDGATIRRLERLLERYHQAPDRAAFIRDEPDEFVRAPWFQNRCSEWREFTTLAEGISFSGRRVLDVGAGMGTDSYRLVAAGAQVTALEYNPMLVRRGLRSLPEARWIGGVSHALPFVSGAFDIVCSNAALHHMRDVATSLEEMIRVLKPGGWLLTTGDSFRARHVGEEHELDVFARHPDVLLGVNESIPSFTAFESVLGKYRGNLDIKIIASNLSPPVSPLRNDSMLARYVGAAETFRHRIRRRLGRARSKSDGEATWNFDRDRKNLGNSSGSIALRCQVHERSEIAPGCQAEIVLAATDYAHVLGDYQQAIQTLAAFVPPHQIDRPFPGERQTKFELMNGWMAPEQGPARRAYRRARWFMRRPEGKDGLTFGVRLAKPAAAVQASVDVLLNGAPAQTTHVTDDAWQQVVIPLGPIPTGDAFVVEIELAGSPAEFDDGVFLVQDREFI